MIFPKVDLRDASVQEVVDFLSKKSKQIDPQGTGIDIKLAPDAAKKSESMRLTLDMRDVPAGELLKYVAGAAKLEAVITPEGAVLDIPMANDSKLIERRFTEIAPSFFGDGPKNPDALKEFLYQEGVPFPKGSAATYDSQTQVLTVTNTQENLELLEVLISLARNANTAGQKTQAP